MMRFFKQRQKLCIRQSAELGVGFFREVGHPTGIFHSSDLTAIASSFGLPYCPGRAIYGGHKLRERLSIYRGVVRLAVFDESQFPINDVAFHLSKPWVAIATGTYDGGYFFEGALFIFDFETGKYWSVLDESREVTRCRFDGDALTILLRPRYEDEFEVDDEFNVFLGAALSDLRPADHRRRAQPVGDPRLEGLVPSNPADFGFDSGAVEIDRDTVLREMCRHAEALGVSFEDRSHVWDVCWLSEQRIALVHDRCVAEVWNPSGRREHCITELSETPQRHYHAIHGAQLSALSSTQLLVNCLDKGTLQDNLRGQSVIVVLDTQTGDLRERAYFNAAHAVQVSSDGTVFARNVSPHRDEGADGRLLFADGSHEDLAVGHYDTFNHYLRIDGAECFYFLRGTPKTSHENKVVCRIDAQTGDVTELWPLDSSGLGKRHLVENDGALLDNGDLVLCSTIHNPNPSATRDRFVERRRAIDGRSVWKTTTTAQPARLLYLADMSVLCSAQIDGALVFVDAATGKQLLREEMETDGAPLVPLSLSYRAGQLVVGVTDGRALIYEVSKN